jgi:hypothetical protein
MLNYKKKKTSIDDGKITLDDIVDCSKYFIQEMNN